MFLHADQCGCSVRLVSLVEYWLGSRIFIKFLSFVRVPALVVASKHIENSTLSITQPVTAALFAMTVAKVFSSGYTAPKRLMDIKHISPIFVSMVQDGVLYYFLYVTAHYFHYSCGVYYLFIGRMLGVFTRQLRSLQLMLIPPNPVTLLSNILLLETAQDLVKASALSYVFIYLNIIWK